MASSDSSIPADTVDSAPQPATSERVQSDRELLLAAKKEGKVLSAFVRLSGPGWLQSAITLGGGSLAGSLFLGVLGGTSMLWLQLVAIVMGVIMLSAISYVTLSTGRRPFEAINNEINPVLGWGWLIATCMANIIWCMPQFSLCYDALDKNIFTIAGGDGLGNDANVQMTVTAILFAAALAIVMMNIKQGKAAKFFDIFLKALIGMVVICFFGVVALLAYNGSLDFGAIFAGFVPDFSQWSQPTGDLREITAGLSESGQTYWTSQLASSQRTVMIAAAATAVGINMTFLLPYSMLSRGWDKPFRGLARFDLSTGMAIPYILVTTCVVVAASASFHGKIDDQLKSSQLAEMKSSPLYEKVVPSLIARVEAEVGAEAIAALSEEEKSSRVTERFAPKPKSEGEQADSLDEAFIQDMIPVIEAEASAEAVKALTEEEKLARVAALSVEEKQLGAALVKRDAFELSQTLSPLLGESWSKLIFGLGVFGMGFSTIIILMLINGYAFREMVNRPNSMPAFAVGVLVDGTAGASWFYFWNNPDLKFYLAIYASTFGSMLLPVAYIAFFLMMNSKSILGDEKPRGFSMLVWNVLMGLSVAGAIVAAGTAIIDKVNGGDQVTSSVVLTLLVGFLVAIAAGFLHKWLAAPRPESIGPESV
ncbi:MAG: divalent metal cation transporter [Planctomycetota bacterium]